VRKPAGVFTARVGQQLSPEEAMEPRHDLIEAAKKTLASGLYDRPEIFDAACEKCIELNGLVAEQYDALPIEHHVQNPVNQHWPE
jgi:hypothetical protein